MRHAAIVKNIKAEKTNTQKHKNRNLKEQTNYKKDEKTLQNQWWKNFENRLRFDEVTHMIELSGTFFGTPCSIHRVLKKYTPERCAANEMQ